MKKRILCRALTGAPIGLAISTAITIFSSFIYGDGNYYPVVPALVEQCGNEINAVVAQMIASLLYGAVWAGASVIWEMDDWSLLRQTVTHLLAGSIATFPVAYLMYWNIALQGSLYILQYLSESMLESGSHYTAGQRERSQS